MSEKRKIYIVTIEWQGWVHYAKSIPFRRKDDALKCALKWVKDFEEEYEYCTSKIEENGSHVCVYNDDYSMIADVEEFEI